MSSKIDQIKRISKLVVILGFTYGVVKIFVLPCKWNPVDGIVVSVTIIVGFIITWIKPS